MAPKRNTAPTMKDVAAEAGVALGTVSKVYNNLPVRDEYREKVLAAAHNWATVSTIMPAASRPTGPIRSLSSGRLSATPSLLTCPMP